LKKYRKYENYVNFIQGFESLRKFKSDNNRRKLLWN